MWDNIGVLSQPPIGHILGHIFKIKSWFKPIGDIFLAIFLNNIMVQTLKYGESPSKGA
jgi:hypothetical protein